MKNLVKSFLFLSLGLASCEQEKMIAPTVTNEVSSANLRESFTANMPKHYQLIQDGDSKLTYFEDGRLKKVTYGPATRGVYNSYALYAYKTNAIIKTLYTNNVKAQVVTFYLDASTGLCYETNQVDYIPYGQNQTLEQEVGFVYKYNGKGQLYLRKNKKNDNSKTSFTYNTEGDITKIINYSKASVNPVAGIESDYTLYYDQPTGDPILANTLPVNLDLAKLPDQYLMIFGKPNTHLVKFISEQYSQGGKVITYTPNADGYITTRQTYDLFSGNMVENKAYDYLITDLKFNL